MSRVPREPVAPTIRIRIVDNKDGLDMLAWGKSCQVF